MHSNTSPFCDNQCAHCSVLPTSFFSVLSQEELSFLEAHKSCIEYKKGEVIFQENTTPAGLFCISKGKVKILHSSLDGKERILRLAQSGDFFGYRALISQDKYHCNATALEPTSICLIDKKAFLELFYNNPTLNRALFIKIAEDLKKAENIIVSLSKKNVRERVAEGLLSLIDIYGYEEDNQTLNVVFSREEIAAFVGTSTEGVIRLLSEFNSDGFIQLVGKKIKIINLSKLHRTANL